ncbi:Ig-like domain-containing protein [Enterovibrio sp. ZSDZ42]|uniref:Ig-like domain-containing protein n=1 Tax=Enterovibrio gelatinilyticus TaxID=2899819 RepID=A0ABT5QZJ7_9GAMM|nr:Ig-like domain-containing protein [Enterovibrio sp. ZSDZ42]MDD1793448.1 Ig-like domain-containing protein [Enterovibrio sp. ZSDZ42]
MKDRVGMRGLCSLIGALLLSFSAQVVAYESVIVIDANVQDPETLFEKAPKESHVIHLKAEDTFLTLSQKLSKYKDIQTLSLYSHGKPGEFSLLGDSVSLSSEESYFAFSKVVDEYLATDGELRLFGCEVAKGAKGKTFVTHLANSTNRTILASDDLTGSNKLGGDWELEYVAGTAEHSIDIEHSEQYAYLLAPSEGTTTFTQPGEYTQGDSPFSKTYNNYTFTVVGGARASISTYFDEVSMGINNDLTRLQVASDDGTEFKLDTFSFRTYLLGSQTMRVQGRKDGANVNGAFKEVTSPSDSDTHSDISFADVRAFSNIDEIWITFPNDDSAVNSVPTFYIKSITIGAAVSDETPPTIQNVVINNNSHKVGDVVEATITVDSDDDDYSTGNGAISGTVNGYSLSGLTKVSNTSYKASFTITDGGTDRAAGDDIPVSLTLTDSSGNQSTAYSTSISQANDAIFANQPHLAVSVNPVSIAEAGGTSTVTAAISGTLNSTWPESLTVNLTYGGTATLTSDYTKSDSITIPAGQPSAAATITAVADSVYDAAQNETVTVQIASASVTSDIDTQQHTVTITDAQSGPTVSFSGSDQSVAENGGTATIGVQLSHATYEDVTVNLSYSGTATSGTDYEVPSASITIPAGSSSANAVKGIVTTDDSTEEVNESVLVNIVGVSGGGATENGTQLRQYTLTDDDDETPPTFSSASSLTNLSATGATLNVSLNEDGKVYYAVVSNGASSPSASEVKAGQVGPLSSAFAVGTITTSSLTGSRAISGLADGTDYDVYVVAEDLLGNLQTSPIALNLSTIDVSPNISTITLSGSPAPNASSISFVVTFGDSVTNISTDDFVARLDGNVVAGLTVSGVSSAQGNSVTVTVSANQVNGTVRLDLNGGTNILDESGTSPSAYASGATHTLDTVAPTITSILRQTPASELTAQDSLVWRVTFSEALSNIDITDFVVSGTTGTVSHVSSTSATVVDVTVSGGDLATANGTVSLSVSGANNLADSSGNGLGSVTASNSQNYLLDNTAPSITIQSASSALIAGQTASVSFNLSEASSNFIATDVVVEGGALSNFAGSGISYTATFTPGANQQTTAKVKVAANKFTDAAGNGNTVATDLPFTVDTQQPTVTISSSLPTLDEGETAAVTFALSESSSNFGLDKVAITGGQLSSFSGSGTTFTATVEASSVDYVGISISVHMDEFSDSSGNGNVAASLTITPTTTNNAPTISGTPSVTADQNSAYSFIPTASDADDNPISFSIVNKPEWADFDAETGKLSGTPSQDDIGAYAGIIISVSDGADSTSLPSFDITVNDVNDQPEAIDDSYVITDGLEQAHSLDVLGNDSDLDGDTLEIVWVSSLAKVSHTVDRIEITASEAGTVIVQYGITDGKGGEATAKVTVTFDSTATGLPTIAAPADVVVNATGLYTRVKLGTAKAFDTSGQPLSVSLKDKGANFVPGISSVSWVTKDGNGNVAMDTQTVTVLPLVSLQKDKQTTEGTSHKIRVLLNGESPIYPLVVPYAVSGTSDSADHDLLSGNVTINSGTEAYITFDVFSDSLNEGTETIVIKLDDSVNIGSKNEFELAIREENIAPQVTIETMLNGEKVSTIPKSATALTVKADVADPNQGDSHSYAWTTTNDSLATVIAGQTDQSSLSFTTENLALNVYPLAVTVTDNGSQPESVTVHTFLEVVESLASLTSQDSDGDLIPDDQEGYGDSDNDGIPNYLDTSSACNVVPQDVKESGQFLLEGEPGVCLRKGIAVLSNQSGAARLFSNELTLDSDATNVGGIFDFVAHGLLTVGQSFKIVIPQRQPIPADAIYRKYKSDLGWSSFVMDSMNSVSSALGEMGYCPPPGDSQWAEGLTEGDWCVQITIEDGGPNDEDGIANGSIIDPSGVAVSGTGNAMPVANDDSETLGKNSEVTIDVLSNDTDADGDALSISSAVADLGAVQITDGKLMYTPVTDFLGDDTISYSVTDSNGGTDNAVVNITVVNSIAPFAANDQYETDDRTPITFNILDNDSDPDGEAIKLVSATATQGEVVVNSDDTVTYTPKQGFEGLDTVTYSISDIYDLQANANAVVKVSLAYDTNVVNSSGGGNGLWVLILGAAASLYRRLKARHYVFLLSLVGTTAQANWFVDGQFGVSRAHDRENIVSNTEYATDEKGAYYSISLGYEFEPDWGASIKYLDMGNAGAMLSSTTTAPEDYHQQVAGVSPLLVEGIGIEGDYVFWRSQKWFAQGHVGVLRWKTEIKSQYQESTLYTSFDGTDPYLGVKFGFNATERLVLGLSFTRYYIEENDVDVGALVLRYQWYED